ncbi:MAG TPA: DUF393 domain-containing protein [Gemmataceae bacterium]|jgi:predicted DCC family thiol-disulfide oxidoreductase YuxK|nr:DUF393 domain-containing protein [Gemmataceae bacterium]
MPAPLSVYYDGLCPLCSREIDHYRKRVARGAVEFVDIANSGFDPGPLGLDPVRVQKHFHVKAGERLYIGVDGFRELWAHVPGFRWLRTLTGLPGVYQASRVLYAVFAWVRPWLPKRKRACTTDRCHL